MGMHLQPYGGAGSGADERIASSYGWNQVVQAMVLASATPVPRSTGHATPNTENTT